MRQKIEKKLDWRYKHNYPNFKNVKQKIFQVLT